MKIKDLVIIASLTAIIYTQEQLLSFIPNVQFTFFLIVLFSKKIGFKDTVIIVILHTLLDNIFQFNLYTFIPMLLGYLLIPIIICSIFKKTENPLILALIGILFSFIYSWCFIIPLSKMMNISIKDYFIADIVFELILAASSFLSIVFLYKPCSILLEKLLGGKKNEGVTTSD